MIFGKAGRPPNQVLNQLNQFKAKPERSHHTPKYEVRLNEVLMAVSPSIDAARKTAGFMPGAVIVRKARGGTLLQAVKEDGL